MVSIDDLMDWKPKQLDTVADLLVKRRKALVDLQDEIDDASPPLTWASGAGSDARISHRKLKYRLNDMVAEVSDVAVSLVEVEKQMKDAKQLLSDALTLAKGNGYTVDHKTGTVTDPGTYEHQLDAQHAETRVQGIADDIGKALTDADTADTILAKALDAAAKGKVEGGKDSLAEAAIQLPPSMDHLSQKELIELLGGDIAISTISAYLEAEAEFATWELEGKAEAKYVVMADGSVKMVLSLEAGLGREISVGGQEADVSAGGTTELELTFKSPEEARKFLQGLDDAALDFDGLSDYASPGSTVVKNVSDYVMDHNITSFKTGVYGKGELELDTPLGEAAMSGRVDAYYDWATDEIGVKVTGSVSMDDIGGQEGRDGSAELSGELKVGKDGSFKDFTLNGKMEASMLNEKLGIDLPPGTSTGQGFDVELKVKEGEPGTDAIMDAIARGDMDEATNLAMDNGRLVIRETTTETLVDEKHDIDVKVADAEIKYGAKIENANVVLVRPAGSDHLVVLDPTQLPDGK